MQGQPVWLASLGRRTSTRTIYVPEWTDGQLLDAVARLRALLKHVGNPQRERLFRMNLTLCLHRAATDAEVAGQPPWFHESRACGLAGGPVEILSETEEGSPSTRPCRHPRHRVIDSTSPHGWIPDDCGVCETCRARTLCEAAP